MDYHHENEQHRQQLLTIVDRGTAEQLCMFLQGFHRRPFRNLIDVLSYNGVIDDQIDFIDCTGTRYNVTPLIVAAGKGSYEKTKLLLVHGANPNKQCATGDTALNLAVHRQKYPVVELLLQYRANPNLCNQSGKTALHRAAVSYTDENTNHIRILLSAGADPSIEDRNQRRPLDEAVIANKPGIVDVLLSHDRTLVQQAHRAAIIASRLGYDKCLKTLLHYGMNPNIADRTHTTPLHVAVRSLKPSTAQLLLAHGANQNMANNRGETPLSLAEHLQGDRQQNFDHILSGTETLPTTPSKLLTPTAENTLANSYPLLRTHPNWTLDSDDFRSQTTANSSVLNLLDASTETYWCCTQCKNAWIIFDLKHEYNISGLRIIGCNQPFTPKNGHLDVSNTFNGPWLKVKDFTCLLSQGTQHDFFFPSLKTRFIRVFILDNYGGNDIRIQAIAFFGVDMRLVDLLQEHGLENSLKTLLANGINDQETLDENRDEILNSSDKYLHVNDHFRFIHLTESLRLPQLTALEWFIPPQTDVIAGDKLQAFSVAGDEGVTDRVKLEQKLENSSQVTTILMRDLEPIQGQSLVDFTDYTIKYPGRYKIRVVSVQSPDIHTSWEEIVVSKKPLEIVVRTTEGAHLYPPGFIPPRPRSTPTTDITDEINEREPFSKPHTFQLTSDPYLHNLRGDKKVKEKKSPAMSGIRQPIRIVKASSESKLVRDYGTQSEWKTTRNIGTMCKPIKAYNYRHELQPLSSSSAVAVQPLGLPQGPLHSSGQHHETNPPQKLSSPSEHNSKINGHYKPRRLSSSDRESQLLTSPQRQKNSHGQFSTTGDDYSPPPTPHRPPSLSPIRPHHLPSTDHQFTNTLISKQRSPSPTSNNNRHVRTSTSRSRSRSPPTKLNPTSSPPSTDRPTSFQGSRRSYKPKHRPQTMSTETDTSLDGMRTQKHRGVQSELRLIKGNATTTSSEKKPPIQVISPTHLSTQTSHSSLSKREGSYITVKSDPPPSKPRTDPHSSSHKSDHSSRVSSPIIVRPEPSPIPHGERKRPPTDSDSDSTRNNETTTKPSLSYGKERQTLQARQSPLLNIGTENFIRQPPNDEYATQFEIDIVHEPNRHFTIGDNPHLPRNKRLVLLPVLNSSRTYVFEKQTSSHNNIHQSRVNGNFYLATPPTIRSLNSSFQVTDSGIDRPTHTIDSDDFSGQHLGSQMA